MPHIEQLYTVWAPFTCKELSLRRDFYKEKLLSNILVYFIDENRFYHNLFADYCSLKIMGCKLQLRKFSHFSHMQILWHFNLIVENGNIFSVIYPTMFHGNLKSLNEGSRKPNSYRLVVGLPIFVCGLFFREMEILVINIFYHKISRHGTTQFLPFLFYCSVWCQPFIIGSTFANIL